MASAARRAIRRPVMIAPTAVRFAVIGPVTIATISCTSRGPASSHDSASAASVAASHIRRSFATDGQDINAPAAADGTLYVGSVDGTVYALGS